ASMSSALFMAATFLRMRSVVGKIKSDQTAAIFSSGLLDLCGIPGGGGGLEKCAGGGAVARAVLLAGDMLRARRGTGNLRMMYVITRNFEKRRCLRACFRRFISSFRTNSRLKFLPRKSLEC